MTKKSLFISTEKEVATTSISKLFNLKLEELQIERTKKIHEVKKEIEFQNQNSIYKRNYKVELKKLGLTPKYKITDLTDLYSRKTKNTLTKILCPIFFMGAPRYQIKKYKIYKFFWVNYI